MGESVMQCPCGSMKNYQDCCELYISGNQSAPTPEALMRSRYAAFSLCHIDYIMKTQCGKAAENFSPSEAKQWAQSVLWLGLTVISSRMKTESQGTVEFIAKFSSYGKSQILHEVSLFECRNHQWFYVDGEMVKSYPSSTELNKKSRGRR